MTPLRSRDNPRVRRWHALAHDAKARAREGRAWLEGAHLVQACLDAGVSPVALIVSEAAQGAAEPAALARRAAVPSVTLSDALFRWIADTPSPQGIAAEIEIPGAASPGEAVHAVFLDALQDAGNVGAILRSAAAFGADTAVLGPGCADAWSPKVLRAAMGGHFALRIAAVADLDDALARFRGRLACAVPRGGADPSAIDLRGSLGWILGAEGRGVSAAAAARASVRLSVPLAPGTESLNVAAAAAILLYERARQLNRRAARS